MERKISYFVISLDFELFWGMFDKTTIETYGNRIKGERTAIPRTLSLFERNGIHATWAAVGMLMARNKKELISLLPSSELRPQYEDARISAYHYLEHAPVGENEEQDPYHYGSSLVGKILATPLQEIGNHTFSHFYCIDGKENRQEIFAADLAAFDSAAKSYGINATSMVFPRNQMNLTALRTAFTHGITAYRGNENHFLYRPRKDSEQSLFIRACRLLDHYGNISGCHTYPLPRKEAGFPINVPSSRFLRPWSKTFSFLEPLRMRRIKNAMTHAAKNGEIFHLWWHPHNFGVDQEQNFKNLETIIAHFKGLQKTYGMQSASMGDIATLAAEQVA